MAFGQARREWFELDGHIDPIQDPFKDPFIFLRGIGTGCIHQHPTGLEGPESCSQQPDLLSGQPSNSPDAPGSTTNCVTLVQHGLATARSINQDAVKTTTMTPSVGFACAILQLCMRYAMQVQYGAKRRQSLPAPIICQQNTTTTLVQAEHGCLSARRSAQVKYMMARLDFKCYCCSHA